MKPKLHELLKPIGHGLHWLGRYDESNAIFMFCNWLEKQEIYKLEELEKYWWDVKNN